MRKIEDSKIWKLETVDDFNENILKEDNRNKVLVFSAKWCHVCHSYLPALDNFLNEHSDSSIEENDFFLVDVDEVPELSSHFWIKGVPLTFFFKNKEIVHQPLVGADVRGVIDTLNK